MSPESTREERAAFKALLGSARARIDDRLAAFLAPRVATAAQVSPEVAAAAGALQRLALRGGKRMRAALLGASYVACGTDAEWASVESAMVAIELLQVYLLVHDDWMDDDDVRRGGPSVHAALRDRLGDRALGDAAAILAGDLASAYAQEALFETALPSDRVVRAAKAYARIQEEVVLGQLAEIRATASVEMVHALKTASYTVTGPVAMGACLAGATDDLLAELARFGRPLGIAFQLRDDLLGVYGDPSATGKPIYGDLRQGKRTALVAEMRGDPMLEKVLGDKNASREDVDALVRAMTASGARARVEKRLEELLAEARAALDAIDLPSAAGKRWLAGAVAALGERTS
jgi:geranylgeranyl diphosphate synthase type I